MFKIVVIAVTCFALAKALEAPDIDALLTRFHQYTSQANAVTEQYADGLRNKSFLYFLIGLGIKDLHKLETEITTIKTTLTKRTSQLNALQVSFTSKLGSEELDLEFKRAVFANFYAYGKKDTEIIDYGDELVKQGKELLKEKTKLSSGEVANLKEYIEYTEKAVRELRGSHNIRYPYVEIPLIDRLRGFKNTVEAIKGK